MSRLAIRREEQHAIGGRCSAQVRLARVMYVSCDSLQRMHQLVIRS
jgi:hypothetical protein